LLSPFFYSFIFYFLPGRLWRKGRDDTPRNVKKKDKKAKNKASCLKGQEAFPCGATLLCLEMYSGHLSGYGPYLMDDTPGFLTLPFFGPAS
jgi:hypothetical protein